MGRTPQLSFLPGVPMTDIVEDLEIELHCENCGRKTKKSVEWVRDHDEFACDCGTTVPVDASKYRKESRRPNPALDGFQGFMEKLGK